MGWQKIQCRVLFFFELVNVEKVILLRSLEIVVGGISGVEEGDFSLELFMK